MSPARSRSNSGLSAFLYSGVGDLASVADAMRQSPMSTLRSVSSMQFSDIYKSISLSKSVRSLASSLQTSLADDKDEGFYADEYETGRVDFVAELPGELVVQIFSLLPPTAIAACSRVSRAWKAVCDSNEVWRLQFAARPQWHTLSREQIPLSVPWREMYRTRHQLEARWQHGRVRAKTLNGHDDSVYCLHFDGQKIVTGSRDHSVKVWSYATGELLRTLDLASDNPPTSPDGEVIGHAGSVLSLQFDEDIMVTGSSDASCIVWDVRTFRPLRRIVRHQAGVLDIALDAKNIVSCSKDGVLSVWDRTNDYAERLRLEGHQGPVNAIDIRGRYIASAGGDCIVKLWDIETGECLRDFRGHSRGLACVQITEDCRMIASGGNDNMIRVWDLQTGRCLRVLNEHTSLVRSLHIHGSRLVSGSYDMTVKVWDLDTFKLTLDLTGWHGSWVFAAKADCRRIVSTSFGSKLVVLDFAHGLDSRYLKYLN
ncbi:WD40-repeat-containing domain protein [Dipodascopsis tothii]|uniref:WD40-repeat-containing domain protein n=1 Tax=Dipodascopsis tothii TaxID=44089 RepID=UPI0034CE769F